MNASPSNENLHFLLRFFRAFTGCITHPYVAWTLFLLLVFNGLVVGWRIPLVFKAESELTRDRTYFYTGLIDAHDDMKELVLSALAASEDCR